MFHLTAIIEAISKSYCVEQEILKLDINTNKIFCNNPIHEEISQTFINKFHWVHLGHRKCSVSSLFIFLSGKLPRELPNFVPQVSKYKKKQPHDDGLQWSQDLRGHLKIGCLKVGRKK